MSEPKATLDETTLPSVTETGSFKQKDEEKVPRRGKVKKSLELPLVVIDACLFSIDRSSQALIVEAGKPDKALFDFRSNLGALYNWLVKAKLANQEKEKAEKPTYNVVNQCGVLLSKCLIAVQRDGNGRVFPFYVPQDLPRVLNALQEAQKLVKLLKPVKKAK
jgi:hypothetical protein